MTTAEPLRYPLIERGWGWQYGPWRIERTGWMRQHPGIDWDYWHEDFDGSDDANDTRCGYGSSRDDCIAEIHRWEDEAEDARDE